MLKKIVSYICSISLILFAFLLTISFLFKWNLRETEIINYLKDNDLSFVLKDKDNSEGVLLKDTREILEKIGIPEETLEEVVNSDATKNFVGKYLTDVLEYLIYQKDKTIITSDDIRALAQQNFPIIEKSLSAQGLSFTSVQKEKINVLVEKYADEVMEFFPTANMVLSKLDQKDVAIYKDITLKELTSTIQLMTSEKWILTLIFLMIISFVFLIICNFKSKKLWFYMKVSTFCYSLIFIVIEVLLGTIIKERLMLKIISAKEFINYMINALSKNIWIFIVIAIVLSFVFAKLQKGRTKNAPILERIYGENKETDKSESIKK